MVAKAGGQLMEFLLTSLPGKNRNNIKTLLNHRQILVNGQVVGFYNHHSADSEIQGSGRNDLFGNDHSV